MPSCRRRPLYAAALLASTSDKRNSISHFLTWSFTRTFATVSHRSREGSLINRIILFESKKGNEDLACNWLRDIFV